MEKLNYNGSEIDDLLIRYLIDSTSELEKQQVQSWLNENPDNLKYFDQLRDIYFLGKVTKSPSDFNKERSLEKIKLRYYQIKHSELNEAKKDANRSLKLWRFSAVASIAILIGLGIAIGFMDVFSFKTTAFVETRSPLGTKTQVTLADGTIVYLSPGSLLKYPAVFSKDKREIILDGEAYLEVAKDVKHPFIVQTAYIDIQVFGTHFNVKAYKTDKKVITTLIEGSVGIFNKVTKNENPIMLKPNQQAMYNDESHQITLREVDAKLYSEWKDDRYYFENETFSSIAKDIERNFNVIIKINYDELRNEKFSGLLDRKKSVYQLLEGLSQYVNFKYTLNNDTILIQQK